MEYFKGLNAREKYDNEMMHHARKQTELLEQIAQLLQGSKGVNDEYGSAKGVSVNSTGKGQQGQRRSYSKRNGDG
jgi:hypothetical protein